jgi:UDP-glucose:glycoprotein glucosyltransferase
VSESSNGKRIPHLHVRPHAHAQSNGKHQKEPKLARARKIPEWEEYDSEISQFSRKLAEQGLIHSRFAAADTNALAGEGTSGGPAEPVVQEADRDIDDSNSDDTSSRRDEL